MNVLPLVALAVTVAIRRHLHRTDGRWCIDIGNTRILLDKEGLHD